MLTHQALASHIEDATDARLDQVRRSLHSSSAMLAQATDQLLDCILQGHRILLFPRRDTQFLAQIACALLHRGMLEERPPLPALLIAPLPDDSGLYSAQLPSLAQPGDVVWVFALHDAEQLSHLIDQAHEHSTKLILLAPPLPPHLKNQLGEDDIVIQLAASDPASLVESGLGAVHAVCDALDQRLLGLI